MDALLEQLKQSPQLNLYLEQMQAFLEAERERRRHFYEVVSEEQKAEFINGEIVVHSPVRKWHNQIQGYLARLLSTFVDLHDAGWVGSDTVMVSLTRNDYEPDLCYFRREKAQHFTSDQTRFPAPDFVVEILSPATSGRDKGIKFEDYAAHGVGEYWIVDPEQEVVEQYRLEDDHYALHRKVNSGQLQSLAVAGFTIPVRAIFDEQENLRALQEILAPR